MENDSWIVIYSPKANRQMRKLDPQARRRINGYMDSNVVGCEDPSRLATRLVSEQYKKHDRTYRFRIGKYRLLCHFDWDAKTVLVMDLALRAKVYSQSFTDPSPIEELQGYLEAERAKARDLPETERADRPQKGKAQR